jgi:phosphonate transport system substrate-binding protein
MRKILIICLCLALSFALAGCGDKTALDSNGVPKTLVIACYNGGLPGLFKTKLEPTRLYLEKQLGVPVEFQFTNDYTAVIEAINAKKVHMAYLSPFSYILASQKHSITPIVAIGADGKPTMYHSIIITNKHTGLKNMDDVKRRAKSLTLCFADPASTSGHLIPAAYLATIGLDPEKNAFKETMFAGSHPATVLTVKSGKVDLGCTTSEYGVDVLVRMNMVKKDDLVVLWQSDPIVASPIVVRNDLNKAFAQKIKDAYLTMGQKDPAALQSFLKVFIADPGKHAYMPVSDSLYNGLRKIAAGIKNLALIKQ